jgi:hypothetical protein
MDREGGLMKKYMLSACCLLTAVFLGLVTSAYTRGSAGYSKNVDNPRYCLAVDLSRAITTAELDYKLKHGVYASWRALVANGDFTNNGTKWGPKNDPRFANVKFSSGSEVLPGWKLRLNLSADGKSFDLLLEDATDEKCGYAAITDERGIIRQGKTIDCEL